MRLFCDQYPDRRKIKDKRQNKENGPIDNRLKDDIDKRQMEEW